MRLALASVLVLLIIFLVPIAVYGVITAMWALQEPRASGRFLLGVLVQKVGTAVAFVSLFYMALDIFGEQRLVYAGIWALMFVITEIGQAIGPEYSGTEALAGAISEIIYFPLSAWVLASILT